MPHKDGNQGKAEESADRRVQSLELRKAGASYRAIGAKLGISEAQAHRDVMTSLEALRKLQNVEAAQVLTIELARLDDMQIAIATQVRQGNHGAIDRSLRIMERRARYLGLDAPTKQEHSGPNQGPITIAPLPVDYRAGLAALGPEAE